MTILLSFDAKRIGQCLGPAPVAGAQRPISRRVSLTAA